MATKVFQITPKNWSGIPVAQQASIISWLEHRHVDFSQVALVVWDEPGNRVVVKEYLLNDKGERYLDRSNPNNLAAAKILHFEERPPFSNVFRACGDLVHLSPKELGDKEKEEAAQGEAASQASEDGVGRDAQEGLS